MARKTKEEVKAYYKNQKAQLKAQLDDVLQKTLTDPEEIKKITDHFKIEGVYNYSFINTMMVLMQGGRIAQSFKAWQKLGRYVKSKEEQPIKKNILVWRPFFKKNGIMVEDEQGNETEMKELNGFNLVNVWDISDTGGKDLEYLHNSKEITDLEYTTLKDGLISKGLDISEDDLGTERGYAAHEGSKIVINKANNDVDKIKTLVHEVAHVWLGHTDKNKEIPKTIREVEAEGVSMIVQSYFGLDVEMSETYIKGWNTTATETPSGKVIEPRKVKVLNTAEKIIRILNPKENTLAPPE